MVFQSLAEWVLENDVSSTRPLYRAIVRRAEKEKCEIGDLEFEEKEYLETTKSILKYDLMIFSFITMYAGVLGVARVVGGIGKKSFTARNQVLIARSSVFLIGVGLISTGIYKG